MKPASFLWLFTCLLVATPGEAKRIDIAHPIEAQGALRIDCRYGRIHVVGGAANEVRITGSVSDELRGVSLRPAAGALELRASFPLAARIRQLWRDDTLYDLDLQVAVPKDIRLLVISREAEVHVAAVDGPVGVGVVSSSVTILGKPSRVDVETVTGSLVFEGETSFLRAITLSGGVEVRGSALRAEVETVSGPVEWLGGVLSNGKLTTISADIRFGARIEAGGHLQIESKSGEVSLACCDPQRTDLELLTRDSDIINELTSELPIRDARGLRRLSLQVTGAESRVEARTRSGTIWLLPPGSLPREPR